jgi:diguanylate cyclase (GGDEF)-like protein
MLGRHLLAFMDEDGRRLCEQSLARPGSRVETQQELKFLRRDGTPVWTFLATNPVYDREGRYAGALAMVADRTEQKRREDRLVARIDELERQAAEARAAALEFEKLATTDSLTGLHNRRHFEERLAAEISRCRRHRRRFCLLLIDLDRFKTVNDRFGHHVGDELLRAAADALRGPAIERASGLLRTSDVVARYGGDELGVIAAETDPSGGMALADRCVARLGAATVPVSTGEQVRAMASIGVASFPLHAEDAGQLLAAADRAMYAAKSQGGCRAWMANREAEG